MLISYMEETQHLDDSNVDKVLNKAADYVEQLCAELGIPLIVHGGDCGTHPINYVKMSIGNPVEVRRKINELEKLSRRLREVFHCKVAGLDASEDVIWLWDIQRN